MSLLAIACWKLVELRAGVDPLTGAVVADAVSTGPSPADEAALEWALRLAQTTGGRALALSAGDDLVERMLREAVAAGASRALRIALDPGAPSAQVAAALAFGVRRLSAGAPVVVCCGDASLDRGSGSVPAFLASELGAAQALGLVALHPVPAGDGFEAESGIALEVERRLDHGRRERLKLHPPCVISVEAVTGRLRRAPLARILAAQEAAIEVVDPAGATSGKLGRSAEECEEEMEVASTAPFRPRTRVVPPPSGTEARARIEELTAARHEPPAARTLVLGPEEAAAELLATLAAWGELPEPLLAQMRHEPARPAETEGP